MNRTRLLYRALLVLAGLALATSFFSGLTGFSEIMLAGFAVAGLCSLAISHLRLRVILASQRSTLRNVERQAREQAKVYAQITKPQPRSPEAAASEERERAILEQLSVLLQQSTSHASAWRVAFRSLYLGIEELRPAMEVVNGLRETGTSVMNQFSALEESIATLEATVTHQDRAQAHQVELRKRLEMLPSEITDHQLLRSRISSPEQELPALGGWALSAPTVNALAQHVLRSTGPLTIVELGSGASTAFLALALQAGPGGHVYSLEHDPDFARTTRERIAALGVTNYSTVIDTLLSDVQPDGDFYDVSGLPKDRIDILLVDGPPAASQAQVRHSALTRLAPGLADGAIICLDDTNRGGEQAVAKRWLQDFPELSLLQRLAKSTLFRWNSQELN